MADKRREVEELRQEISKLDVTLRTTLERRARLSRKIGELGKTAPSGALLPSGGETDRWMEGATGDMPLAAMREIFREILATCLSLERPVVVSFSGAEGCFVHAAARSRFGIAAEYTPCDTVAGALEEVTRGRAGYAVVPLETRTDGLLQATIMALVSSDLKIVLSFEIVENLQLASKADSMTEVDKVYAMAKDRAHSARYLAHSSAQPEDVATPMLACQLAAADPRAAALAHESIAAEQGLHVLDRNVRDDGEERVRYAVVGMRPSARSGSDLTAIVFAVNDSPGALHDVLRQFAERGINLTKIQSRPTQGVTWQYLFFIEVQGHSTDRPIVGALEELRRYARYFKVLGSYPAA